MEREKDEKDILAQIESRIALKTVVMANQVERAAPSDFAKCDGSIKKNTSFIKKIKLGITSASLESLKKEILALKQEKYLEEIAISVAEATYKSAGDVLAAVEICTLLDHRYSEFAGICDLNAGMLIPAVIKFIKPLSSPCQVEKEEATRLLKLKSAMRLLIELNLVGLAPDSGKQKIVPGLLHGLLGNDKNLANINIAVTFAKMYYSLYCPDSVLSEPVPLRDQLNSEAIRLDCQKVLLNYFNMVTKTLIKEHTLIQKIEKSNQDSFIARGEITEDRQTNYEKRVKAYDKLKINAQTLASCLKQEMPELQKDEQTTRMKIGISDARESLNKSKDSSLGIWEDEEMKSFYEKLLDLANQVPAILLGGKSKQNSATDVSENVAGDKDPEGEHVTDNTETDAPINTEKTEDQDGDDGGDLGKSRLAFTTISSKLLNALSRDTIDQIAVEFAFINNKGTRKRLISTLVGVSRQRLDLLPYYSRLIATLNVYMPDIGAGVIEELESSFHYHQKKKDQVFIEEKLKNIRYIGELTKFRITPNHVVFHCLKVLLDDFNFHNVELACALLESCGRFLYFNPETNQRTANFLEILLRKKTVQSLDTKYSFMIDNAVFACNPPEVAPVVKKIRTPYEMFLRKLVYKDMCRSNIESILKILRKSHWDNPDIVQCLRKVFFKIWKIKFSNLHLLAFLTAELSRFYPHFGIEVVDNTLEEIRLGMEKNLFKQNQRRIAFVKFLGELYNYRMIDATTIFDTLYLLLRFGHPNGIPTPGAYCAIDAPNDFFRLRLACTLLDTCGGYFKKGHTAKKLDNYFVFLQMYIFTKNPIPVDAEFFVMETKDLLRPNLEIIPTYEECISQLNEIAKSQIQDQSDDDEEDRMMQQDEEREGQMEPEQDQAPFEEADDDDIDEDLDDEEEDSEEEEVIVHLAQHDPEPEDEMFEREFGRMMQESMESRRNVKKPGVFDAPIPSRKQEERENIQENEVAFTLLTKRGNKQQAKQMALPSTSFFAVHTIANQQAEQEERVRLKHLVLGYQERERAEEAKRSAVKDLQSAIKQKDIELDEVNQKLQEQLAGRYPEGVNPNALLQRLEKLNNINASAQANIKRLQESKEILERQKSVTNFFTKDIATKISRKLIENKQIMEKILSVTEFAGDFQQVNHFADLSASLAIN